MASVEQTSNPTPAVTVTPASPTNTTASIVPSPTHPSTELAPIVTTTDEMKEKNPTDSETALLAQNQGQSTSSTTSPSSADKAEKKTSGRTSPLETLTRRLSGKASSPAEVSKTAVDGHPAKQEKPTNGANPAPTATVSASRSAPTTSASTSRPTTTSHVSATAPKKKKKRKGLAGLFVALGCLSANDFEDDVQSARPVRKDMAQKPAAKPATSTGPVEAGTTTSSEPTGQAASGPETDTSKSTQTTTATGSTVPQSSSKTLADTPALAHQQETIVIAPIEPVQIPEDEVSFTVLVAFALLTEDRGSDLFSSTAARIRLRAAVYASKTTCSPT